ncbi:hypothetical protein CDAR_374221 [Caerostris darwini]|uniref:Uncharacterized protein n=1 Tax=Caerostris darwini TaxID=1538125 RepID=A0AAV4NMF6_9ARAC|nr:hypothetical protein CDAR_374221 [Caerostris darwini]
MPVDEQVLMMQRQDPELDDSLVLDCHLEEEGLILWLGVMLIITPNHNITDCLPLSGNHTLSACFFAA